MKAIYLDYNATTPVAADVADSMIPYLRTHFGNPSSSHAYGLEARRGVEIARRRVADLLSCDPDEVVFTGGGSESNNNAIRGAALALRDRGNHIVTSAIEHPAVTEVCRYLETRGFHTTYVPVDGEGLVSVEDVEKALTPETILITIMHANNEVGTIQPVGEIAQLARRRGILVHTDAAQTVGKIPARVDDLGIDLLSIAGHKLYAPKGIGALYVRSGTPLRKLIHGADHEQGRRAGTENVPAIAGLGRASEIAAGDLEKNMWHLQAMRDRLHEGLVRRVRDVKLNGHPEKRLPNTLNVGFRGIRADALLSRLDGVAASPGAACHSGECTVSRVLEAMRVAPEYALGAVRFSTGRETCADDIDRAVELVAEAVRA